MAIVQASSHTATAPKRSRDASKLGKQDNVFWQLFPADRWVPMMIGLPYMLPDCDLEVAPIGEASVDTWVHRQLIIVTGRVIDCVQDTRGPVFSKAIELNEHINDV